MKIIKLFGPTIVDGVVRHPYENPLTVSNREAARLLASGVLPEDPEDAPGGAPEPVDEQVDKPVAASESTAADA